MLKKYGPVTATSCTLTDNDHAYTTYVAGSLYAGSNGITASGASNANLTDAVTGDTNCSSDACGCGSVSGGSVTVYLGNGATENAGGSLSSSSTVYVYFQVTID